MGLRRRAFLGQACLLLAGLGVSEVGLSLASSRYRQVLAQPTRRKLALLVGINQYSAGKEPALRGCLTDVELQRELLLHRFGFQASDVLVLRDQQATRHNIETAFMTHLVEQTRPDDVIVFHYSGYGRRVRLGLTEDGIARGRKEQNALVPVDSVLSTVSGGVPTVNDLLEETLFLLLRSLPTDQVTTILDTSYTYPVAHGNLQIRTQLGFDSPKSQLAEAELAFQEHLLSQVDFSREQVAAQLRSRQLPGVILAAAGAGQFAAEAHWQGFSAGLFTYGLTQQLWQTTPATTLRVNFTQAIMPVQQLAGKGQQPELTGQKSRQRLSAYAPVLGVGADGAVTAIAEDGRVTLWLGGLPVEVLEQYSANSILTLRPAPGQSRVLPATSPNPQATDPAEITGEATPTTQLRRIQLNSVSGLSAEGRCLPESTTQGVTVPVQVGQLVQEAIRVLPQTSLTIALDASLERIERVDATSAFSAMLQISCVEAGEPADYLFAKETETPPLQVRPENGPWHSLINNSSVSQSRYGLFFLGGSPISNTLGEVGEAIKAAVWRLTPKLQALLANKLLGLTINENSSCLGISATLETVAPQPQVLVRQQTSRAPWQSKGVASSPAKAEAGALLTIPAGSRIRYRVHNYSDRPVYAVLLGLDSGVNAFAFYPVATDNPEAKPLLRNELISPGETLVIPQVSDPFEWGIHGPTGLSTTYLILSCEPLNQTLARLEVLRQNSDTQQISALPNFLEVAQSVLQDLHQAGVASHPAGLKNEIALDVNTWATLRFIYQVT